MRNIPLGSIEAFPPIRLFIETALGAAPFAAPVGPVRSPFNDTTLRLCGLTRNGLFLMFGIN
jgi:hypothetical protein